MDVYQRRRLVALSILAGAFIIIVLLIRSCGGDDDEAPITPVSGATGTGGAASLSQSDFIDQADTTCLEANTALASVDQSDAVVAATEEAQIIAGELESLQTLAPPTDGADQLEKFLAALQDQVSAYDRYITALERGDEAATAELETAIDDAAAQAERRAGRFGFEVCGDTSQVGESSGGDSESAAGGEESAETAPTAPAETVPAEPVTPAPTTPAPAPEGGSATPAPAPAPAPDSGSDSGGVTP